jgi:UDP-N-acetylmuramoyl-L-alanyl-D-glutamate--2,6-diaminopimelate ligase
MKAAKLKDVLKSAGSFKILQGSEDVLIKSIEETSSDVKPGALFVCVKGISADGHDFAQDAVNRGAAALLVDRITGIKGEAAVIYVKDTKAALYKITEACYGAAKKKAVITGVTGTKGKTTVTYMIAAVLQAALKKPVSVIGTVAYKIGNKVYESKNTTPSNLVLHKLIEESVNKGAKYIVMEVSSHALDQARIKNIMLDTAVVTNVTRDHFDYHKTFENYLAAKLKIADNLKSNGVMVVNLDDKSAGKFIKRAKGRRLITYSMNKAASVKTVDYTVSIKGMEINLIVRKKPVHLKSGLVGEHNIHNLMAAAGAALGAAGLKDVKSALSKFKGVKGRMQAVYNGDFTVIVDFAHTAGSLEETLKALGKVKKGRIITVFGAGGNRDKGKRPMMGAVAEALSDIVVVTSDNPRFEKPMEIIKDVLAGMKGQVKTYVEEKREKAVKKAIRLARHGDIVLLAGKGHETYQDINGKKLLYDDEHAALRAIEGLK